jgi:Fur family peroxide stress response transcriptional regulator
MKLSDTQKNSLHLALGRESLRSTRQREHVFSVLLDKRDHPTADEVYARAKRKMPSISLATVYNCLETLVECRLVKQVNFERKPSRFCPNLAEHAHFYDEGTGRVFDVDLPKGLYRELISVLPEQFKATTLELSFRGENKDSSTNECA